MDINDFRGLITLATMFAFGGCLLVGVQLA